VIMGTGTARQGSVQDRTAAEQRPGAEADHALYYTHPKAAPFRAQGHLPDIRV